MSTKFTIIENYNPDKEAMLAALKIVLGEGKRNDNGGVLRDGQEFKEAVNG